MKQENGRAGPSSLSVKQGSTWAKIAVSQWRQGLWMVHKVFDEEVDQLQ